MAFSITRRVHYYETDAMAVVHHSNHLKMFEEARVAWFRKSGLAKVTWEDEAMYFPLVKSNVEYKKPIFFDDQIEIRLQVKQQGVKFIFEYAIYVVEESQDLRSKAFPQPRGELPILCATGGTIHVLVDQNFNVNRSNQPKLKSIMEKESWTETWP